MSPSQGHPNPLGALSILPFELRRIVYYFALLDTPISFPIRCTICNSNLPALAILETSRALRKEVLSTIYLDLPVQLSSPHHLLDLSIRFQNAHFRNTYRLPVSFPRRIHIRLFTRPTWHTIDSLITMPPNATESDKWLPRYAAELDRWSEVLKSDLLKDLRDVVFDFGAADKSRVKLARGPILRFLGIQERRVAVMSQGRAECVVRTVLGDVSLGSVFARGIEGLLLDMVMEEAAL